MNLIDDSTLHRNSEDDLDTFTPGKVIMTVCILLGVFYNIYLLIQILNIMNIVHEPKTKFYEAMNQLEAYMKMKQFPLHLQKRCKLFYRKKFRNSYYIENEIMEILSEPLQREILINSNQFFVERVDLFKNIPKALVTKIAASCKKEEFLPNDLVSFASL